MAEPLNPRAGKAHALPYDLRKLTAGERADLGALVERVVKAQQENNDSLHSDMVGFMKRFNQLARDFEFIAEYLGVEVDPSSGQAVEVTGAGSTPSHDELDGVSPDDHHDEVHSHMSHSGSLQYPLVFPSEGDEGPMGFGLQGKRGAKGARSVVPGPPGLEGEQGDMGFSIQGPRGATGATGATGAAGADGAAGATGATGPRGASVTGPPGVDGEDGALAIVPLSTKDAPSGQNITFDVAPTAAANEHAAARPAHGHQLSTSGLEPGVVSTTSSGTAGTSGLAPSRGDHAHDLGFDDATSNPLAVSTAAADGTEGSAARKDHVHAHEAAHVAHDTIWDAAGDYVRGSAADTAVRQAASAATPVAVTHDGTATAGTAANPPSADDHKHGLVSYSSEPPAVSTSTSGTAGSSGVAPSRGDHSHDLGTHAHSGATVGGTIDHGALDGLGDDDHSAYPNQTGTETISGVWDFTNLKKDTWHASSDGKNRFHFANNGITYVAAGSDATDLLHVRNASNTTKVYVDQNGQVYQNASKAVLDTDHKTDASGHTGLTNSALDNRTRYIWIGPGDWIYDDAAAVAVGTTPDLVGASGHSEAGGRTGIYATFLVPEDWVAASTMQMTLVWFTTTASGNVVWTARVDSLASGANPTALSNLTSGGAGGIAIADSTTVKYSSITTWDSAASALWTPAAAGDLLAINVERNAGHANDTATGAARLLGIRIAYTADM